MAPKAKARGGTSVSSFAKSAGKASQSSAQSASLLAKKLPQTVVKSREQSPTYTKEQLGEADGREDLHPDDSKYDALWKEVQKKMGMPKNKPIHSEGMNRIEHILRVFDLDPAYGPCLGLTRLERWQRADKLGDEPPPEIKEILETRQGVLEHKFSVLHDKGV